ncbi:hypothetical protein [Tenacibaculum maritimum]|uniref:hypothetical protein n=1 Tax=Tenacibaculum maritimum TaxID=107401 RepID=UPI0012E3FDC4|nr:hypothetical protein [Tenacibaculum maritimum]CAA0231397.1 conserved hypothetical protein [Tenacibaculum maritimum]
MKDIELHHLIITKLEELYGDLDNLKTNNSILHTKVFYDLSKINQLDYWNFIEGGVPLLECKLKNGNYILSTTKSLYSIYNGEKYKMDYEDFEKSDKKFFSKNTQLGEGGTRVFNYFLKNGNNFMYEIDSLYPADIVHNRLVLTMKFKKD